MRGRAVIRQHHPRAEHYFLRCIGVDPDRQGTGVGVALVQPMLDRADRDGVGCFLTTAAEAKVGWYERFGFAVSATLRPTPQWPTVWAMWRDPTE
jgi:N-acetylglutamate synthase-like GNAT family acetyltransferase